VSGADSDYPANAFTQHGDGRITVDQWYPRQIISPALLGSGSDEVETRITISVANGRAVYRIIGMTGGDRNYVCDLLEASLDGGTDGPR